MKLICINKDGWELVKPFKIFKLFWMIPIQIRIEDSTGPKLNEIVTFDGFDDSIEDGTEYIFLKEYDRIDKNGERDSYHRDGFVPYMSNEEFAEMLKEEEAV